MLRQLVYRLFGVNISQYTIATRLTLIKGITPLLAEPANSICREGVINLICNTKDRDLQLLRLSLESPKLMGGYVDLYSLLYKHLAPKIETTCDKFKFPPINNRELTKSTRKYIISHFGTIKYEYILPFLFYYFPLPSLFYLLEF